MAHLCFRRADEWLVLHLQEAAYSLATLPPRPIPAGSSPAPWIAREGGSPERWVLLAPDPGPVRINGLPLDLGIRVLRDRDRVQLNGVGTVWLSTEEIPREEAFAGGPEPVRCPRCQLSIDRGQTTVRCPGCRVRFHSTSDLPCWTAVAICAHCGHPTDLAEGLRWLPGEVR